MAISNPTGSGFSGTGPGVSTQGLSALQFNNPINFGNKGGGFMDFFGGKNFGGMMDLGSLALNAYGLNKSLGFAEDQLDLMKEQEQRAATAQNFQTGNSLAMALQMTTPGTPEHERIKQAISKEQFTV